jgi:hypothetical protein
MRAVDFIVEQTEPSASKLVAKSGNQWIWKISESTYIDIKNKYNTMYSQSTTPIKSAPSGTSAIWFVSNQTTTVYDPPTHSYQYKTLTPDQADPNQKLHWIVFAQVDQDLLNLVGDLTLSKANLVKLAKVSGALNARNLNKYQTKNHTLYQGQVQHIKDVKQQYAIEPLKNGSLVYKIPIDLYWTIGYSFVQDPKSNWNVQYQIENPVAGTIVVWAKDNTVVKHSFAGNKAVAAVKSIQELAAREGLEMAAELPAIDEPTASTKKVKPGSVMHKMLAYVAEHPGATRSDWFVKHLGRDPQGLQSWTSDTAHDGVAASMGWIRNDAPGQQKYSLHITNIGRLVLARLNKGVAAPYTKEI